MLSFEKKRDHAPQKRDYAQKEYGLSRKVCVLSRRTIPAQNHVTCKGCQATNRSDARIQPTFHIEVQSQEE
jgi:hypothetical protein